MHILSSPFSRNVLSTAYYTYLTVMLVIGSKATSHMQCWFVVNVTLTNLRQYMYPLLRFAKRLGYTSLRLRNNSQNWTWNHLCLKLGSKSHGFLQINFHGSFQQPWNSHWVDATNQRERGKKLSYIRPGKPISSSSTVAASLRPVVPWDTLGHWRHHQNPEILRDIISLMIKPCRKSDAGHWA